MLREFTDSAGREWRVWDVYPSPRSSKADQAAASITFGKPELAEGWLCFESAQERRRLAPIPPTWEVCEGPALEELCSKAGYASPSTSPDGSESRG